MKDNVKLLESFTDDLKNDIINLIHESFVERTEDSLFFSCSNISKQEMDLYCKNRKLFCYILESKIIGVIFFYIKDKKCYVGIVATHPKYKKNGIATALFQELVKYCREKNVEYIFADTAIKAKSSVRWHEKMGFKKFKMTSFPSTNYYSWEFVKDIKNPNRNVIKRNIHLFLSSIICPLCWDKNGKLTSIGKLIY